MPVHSKGEFRNGPEFAASMVSLRRIGDVNRVAHEAALASQHRDLVLQDRRRLERENKLLLRQLRSALICSAYSIAEEVIIGLAPKPNDEYDVHKANVKKAYCKRDENPSFLHFAQYRLQHVRCP